MPAIGFLLKQPAGIAGLPVGIYVLLPAYRRARGLRWRHSVAHAAWLCLGFAGALLGAAVILNREGILREAFYWSVQDHGVTYGPLSRVFWERGGLGALIFSISCAPLLLGAWWSLRARELWEGLDAERIALLVFLGVTMLGTAASGRFFIYYYIQILPPLCLLAAPWYGRLWSGGVRRPLAGWTAAWVAAMGTIFLVINVVEMPDALGQAAVSRYIRTHASPEDRLFVWGQYPKFYLHADLRPATRYIAFFPLTGYIFGSPWNHDPTHEDTSDRILPGSWDNLQRDFALHPPRYILDTEGIRHPPKYPVTQFPVLNNLLVRNYRLAFMAPEGALYELRNGTPGAAP
jgi:hypothetical protein